MLVTTPWVCTSGANVQHLGKCLMYKITGMFDVQNYWQTPGWAMDWAVFNDVFARFLTNLRPGLVAVACGTRRSVASNQNKHGTVVRGRGGY